MNQARPKGAPSIYHTCRQRGTPQHKARCALSNFFHDAQRRAQRKPTPQVSCLRAVHCLCLQASNNFGIYFHLKVAAVVGASALKLEHKAGGRGRETERPRQQGKRESERSGPLFLCLMRVALRRELEGDAHTRISATLLNTQLVLLRSNCQGALMEFRQSLCGCCVYLFISLSLGDVATQDKACQEVCGGKDLSRTQEKSHLADGQFVNVFSFSSAVV